MADFTNWDEVISDLGYEVRPEGIELELEIASYVNAIFFPDSVSRRDYNAYNDADDLLHEIGRDPEVAEAIASVLKRIEDKEIDLLAWKHPFDDDDLESTHKELVLAKFYCRREILIVAYLLITNKSRDYSRPADFNEKIMRREMYMPDDAVFDDLLNWTDKPIDQDLTES